MRFATYQAVPEKHDQGVFIYTSCGHQIYSIRDEMAYHGCLCPACFYDGKETTLYIQGSEEARKENERHVCNR